MSWIGYLINDREQVNNSVVSGYSVPFLLQFNK